MRCREEHHDLSDHDRALVEALIDERRRLLRELDQLTNARIAEKLEIPRTQGQAIGRERRRGRA